MLGNILNKIKNVKFNLVIYPAVLLIFILVTVYLFVSAAKFLSQNINKGFIPEGEVQSELIRLDIPGFYAVAKKLGITIETERPTPEIPPATPAPAIIPASTSTATTTTSTEVSPTEDKTSLKIAVFNSTRTSGLAAALKTDLINAGFAVEKTGNQSPALETTIIKVKENKRASPLTNEIKNIVSQKYAAGQLEQLEEGEIYDVVIVIGNK